MKNDRKKSADDESRSHGKRDREIGEGMHSLDSTQAPLRTDTGLPDYEAMTGGKEPSATDRRHDEDAE